MPPNESSKLPLISLTLADTGKIFLSDLIKVTAVMIVSEQSTHPKKKIIC